MVDGEYEADEISDDELVSRAPLESDLIALCGKLNELEARGITRAAAGAAMSVPRSRCTDIINGRKRISVDTALRLERFFGIRANLWLGLQNDYELKLARKDDFPAIERRVAPVF